MSAKVTLTIKEGAGQGQVFTFLTHDTFLLGRMDECHIVIKDDDFVSRHHFLLEACPPQASLRDLGSLNGTFVNGKVCGGRKPGDRKIIFWKTMRELNIINKFLPGLNTKSNK